MNTNKSVGQKIETLARVTATGTACVGMMAWETPFIRFTLMANDGTFTGASVIWHSDSAVRAASELKPGVDVALSGFCYGGNMRRVQVGYGCKVFGIGQI